MGIARNIGGNRNNAAENQPQNHPVEFGEDRFLGHVLKCLAGGLDNAVDRQGNGRGLEQFQIAYATNPAGHVRRLIGVIQADKVEGLNGLFHPGL